jgi:AraC family transcriptional regulator
LSLDILANIACFSPFHFHRIFYVIVGETTHEFVNRKRIEKIAGCILTVKSYRIKELAYKYGFQNPASLARAFKKYYGMSATEFKNKPKAPFSKIIKQNSKIGKEIISFDAYINNVEAVKKWMGSKALIETKRLPEQKLVYVRNKGSFDKVPQAFEKLLKWAQPLGLLKTNTKLLMVIHDSPVITKEIQMTQSACLTLEEDIIPGGEAGTMTIPPGKFLIGRFELTNNEFEQAWNGMSIWMVDHGCISRDGHYFELFHSNSLVPFKHEHRVDICIPIV